jgi:hypothetical protein
MTPLTRKEMTLLLSIVHSKTKQSRKLFDKHDYCIQKGVRFIAEVIGSSKSTVDRLIQKLKSQDLLREVIDCFGEQRPMLKPSFIRTNRSQYEEWFLLAMYYQGSHSNAQQYAFQCRTDGVLYDFDTFGELVCFSSGEITYGQVIRPLTMLESIEWQKSIEVYTATDRTKRRKSRLLSLAA